MVSRTRSSGSQFSITARGSPSEKRSRRRCCTSLPARYAERGGDRRPGRPRWPVRAPRWTVAGRPGRRSSCRLVSSTARRTSPRTTWVPTPRRRTISPLSTRCWIACRTVGRDNPQPVGELQLAVQPVTRAPGRRAGSPRRTAPRPGSRAGPGCSGRPRSRGRSRDLLAAACAGSGRADGRHCTEAVTERRGRMS